MTPIDVYSLSPAEAREEAERRTLVFLLPLPPNRANARQHWSAVHRGRTKYERELGMLQLAKMIPPPPPMPLEHATVSAHLVVGNMMDADNAMARCKWPLDFLVKAGYLVDDDHKHLTWAGVPTQAVNRKSPSLTLTLTPR